MKQEIDKLVFPANASIITFDAVVMYTTINIDNSIPQIMGFLSTIWNTYDCKATEEAMNIVMQNNPMQFGNLIFCQTRGAAMVQPLPTSLSRSMKMMTSFPLLANISCTKRDSLMMVLLSGYTTVTLLSTQVIGMNSRPSGQSWTFMSPRKKLIFMDMTIKIEGERLITTIYAKPMALYQYIPPSSCHPLVSSLVSSLGKCYKSTNSAP